MKKKFKLLTSIASLGLALAVMAFGVFAATAHTVTINSSVKFEANNVNVTVKVVQDTAEATEDLDYSAAGTSQTVTDQDEYVFDLSDPAELDDTTVKYGYQVTITNLGGTKVAFEATSTPANNADSLAGVTITVTGFTSKTLAAASDQTEEDVLVYTVQVVIDPNVAMDITEEALLDLTTEFALTRVVEA